MVCVGLHPSSLMVVNLSHPQTKPQITTEVQAIIVIGLGLRVRRHQETQVLRIEVGLRVQRHHLETQLDLHTKVELLARSILRASKLRLSSPIDLRQEPPLLLVGPRLSFQLTLLDLVVLVLVQQTVLVVRWMS